MPRSYAVEVIADDSGEWSGNALRFADKLDAADYAAGLYARWTLVRETRVVETDDEPNR